MTTTKQDTRFNVQKSTVLLYTWNETSESKKKKKILLKSHQKNKKHPRNKPDQGTERLTR